MHLSKIPLLASLVALSVLSGCKGNKRPGKIRSVVVLGNSIVLHGAAPQIGWTGEMRGMASTVPDSDFVHLLRTGIKAKDSTVTVKCSNLVGFEWKFGDFDFHRADSFTGADMYILRFSENVDDNTVTDGNFFRQYDKLIRFVDPEDKAVKVVVSGIWYKPVTNRLLEEYAQKHDYIFVKNDDLLADSSNTSRGIFNDPGVAAHPSDKGMRRIKERIWEKIKPYF